MAAWIGDEVRVDGRGDAPAGEVGTQTSQEPELVAVLDLLAKIDRYVLCAHLMPGRPSAICSIVLGTNAMTRDTRVTDGWIELDLPWTP
jgi:hypothetical protein